MGIIEILFVCAYNCKKYVMLHPLRNFSWSSDSILSFILNISIYIRPNFIGHKFLGLGEPYLMVEKLLEFNIYIISFLAVPP